MITNMVSGRIPLFPGVDYEVVWGWSTSKHPPKKVTTYYYHYCNPEYLSNIIEVSGTCTHCGTHIAPYKKLDTILGLKNLHS